MCSGQAYTSPWPPLHLLPRPRKSPPPAPQHSPPRTPQRAPEPGVEASVYRRHLGAIPKNRVVLQPSARLLSIFRRLGPAVLHQHDVVPCCPPIHSEAQPFVALHTAPHVPRHYFDDTHFYHFCLLALETGLGVARCYSNRVTKNMHLFV